mmetsp:Transcript_29650/g.50270  ORF Transcript_29650/g.50270 Transcript_29650/m.50270 type:complete len:274 (-) Transcript_29650:151-972(-)
MHRIRHFARSLSLASITGTSVLALGSWTTAFARSTYQKDIDDSIDWNRNWDGKDSNGAKTSHTFIMVRHGQYVYGKTDTERKLTELGRKQATRTGERLKALEEKGFIPPIKRVVYSTMTRATETHKLISAKLSPEIPRSLTPKGGADKALRRIEASDLIREGAVCPPIPPHQNWKPTPEAFEEDGNRIEKGFRSYMKRASPADKEPYSTLLVCHGNVIRYFILRCLQLPPERWLNLTVHNASITLIKVNPSGDVSVKAVGDVGHFDPEDITYG